MKKIVAVAVLMMSFQSWASAIILNPVPKSDYPSDEEKRKVCEVVVSNEKSTFYDCGNYVLSYTPKAEGNRSDNPQYYRYCQKKEDGSLAGCTYL